MEYYFKFFIGVIFLTLFWMPYESLSRPLDLRGCPFMNSNQKREYQNQWERLQEIEDVVALKPRIINFLDDIDKHCGGYVEDRQKIILFVNAHFKELYKKQIAFLTSEIERSSRYRPPYAAIQKLRDVLDAWSTSIPLVNHLSVPVQVQLEEQGRNAAHQRKHSCSNQDNRRFPLMGVRDQDGIGWCYAFTAADLLSYKTGQLISAVDVANAYNDESMRGAFKSLFGYKEADIEGGWIEDALEAANKRGLCLEQDLPSSDVAFTEYLSLKQALKRLEEDQTKLEEAKKQHQEEEFQACEGPLFARMLPNLSISDITDILNRTPYFVLMDTLIEENCKGKRLEPIENLSITAKYKGLFSDTGSLIKEMDDQLNHNNIVGISYYANILDNRFALELEGPHASSVVGRRWVENRQSCEYLVRNSWGANCTYDFSCDRGYVWVPEDFLSRTLEGITYVQ
ncbi:MAG: hypothetical protein A2Z91_02445 [Deltaproteobacteria bacterium GWA2_38_16]|nr:MAG: hypothetical protein A2Z91_02445 [Deltaproteobacteria bacterium GWA2_38_16]OGQ02054.1 MAG: hypothetical protein A3D19_08740 [Deltaproteobacteria bacterium RIFCSPHIGHO2_02_FULL_38_15]OGQ64221.1 MAG: hypothetical protein A3G92_06420 [Deltaproteobacteria bacterium RIFCSPLOWO2_12_FULL_38_8]HBQ21590.1 hypothetical protein [Deltaproteobacteria bacterium]